MIHLTYKRYPEMQELDRSSARRVLDEKSEKMWSVAVDDLPVVCNDYSRFELSWI